MGDVSLLSVKGHIRSGWHCEGVGHVRLTSISVGHLAGQMSFLRE